MATYCGRPDLKSTKITGEAASADEEDVATFTTELKNIIEKRGYHPKQFFVTKRDCFGRFPAGPTFTKVENRCQALKLGKIG